LNAAFLLFFCWKLFFCQLVACSLSCRVLTFSIQKSDMTQSRCRTKKPRKARQRGIGYAGERRKGISDTERIVGGCQGAMPRQRMMPRQTSRDPGGGNIGRFFSSFQCWGLETATRKWICPYSIAYCTRSPPLAVGSVWCQWLTCTNVPSCETNSLYQKNPLSITCCSSCSRCFVCDFIRVMCQDDYYI
jgi:hypothetical protein